MKEQLMGRMTFLVRLLIAGIFLYGGVKKLNAPQQFADKIAAYQVLPIDAINLSALTLPPLEVIVGFLLLSGFKRRFAVFSALVMTGLFFIALVSAIARGLAIECGCFGSGPSKESSLWFALLRDCGLGTVLFWNYLCELATERFNPTGAAG